MEVFAVFPKPRSCFYDLSDHTNCSNLLTSCLFLVPSPLVFSYYGNLFSNKVYYRLLLSIACSTFEVYTALQFLWAAVPKLTATFKEDPL